MSLKSSIESPAWENPKSVKKRSLKRKSFISESHFVDWDDTNARSSFECSLARNESNVSAASFDASFNQTITDSYQVDFSQFSSLCSSTPKAEAEKQKRSSTEIPSDLRLGTKIRLISQKHFPWMTNVKSTGVHSVRIPEEDIDLGMRISIDNDPETGYVCMMKSPLSLLQAAATFYQYPSLCSVPMFPRLDGTLSKNRLLKMANLQALCPKFMDDIVAEWCQSFDRLYNLWKKGKRRSFYLCAPSFTVLFSKVLEQRQPLNFGECSISSDSCKLRVVITPTSLGFRQTLHDEGIKFSLPLRADVHFADLTSEDCPKDFLPKKDKGDLDHDEWLKEIGISPKSTLKLRRSASIMDFPKENDDLEKESVSLFASQPAFKTSNTASQVAQQNRHSTILIQDLNSIDGLYNVLRKTKIAFTRNGPHSGLPPTLIASAPFYKAVPRELNITSQATKKSGELRYILELEGGPVLPFVQGKLVEFMEQMAPNYPPNEYKAKIQVNGRSAYAGINEALDSISFVNAAEFEVELVNNSSTTFSW